MKKQIFFWALISAIFILGCQKEVSFEQGNVPGAGSLQSDATGDCLPKTVAGTYLQGTALVPATNTITVSVMVTKTGSYTITTDTVAGIYFKATGTFLALGATNVTLQGNGTPSAQGIRNFQVTYGTSICDIQVTILPSGTSPAVLTLAGSGTPPSCTTPVIAGTFAAGTPLGNTNTVTLNVNVTTAGSYNLSTTAVNGMTFTGAGTVATGAQTIVLTGSGTPGTAGNSLIPVTIGTSTCNFTIVVGSGAAFTLVGAPNCTTPVISGNYTAGTPLTNANTVVLNVNVTTAGGYNVSTGPVNGMTFSGSGTLATGAQTITLTGSGTPVAAGNNTFPVTVGSSTCSFPIVVQAGAGPAVGTLDGGPGACTPATPAGTYTAGTALTTGNTVQIQVDVTAAGSYNITTNTVSGFSFAGTGNLAIGNNLPVTLTGTGTPLAAGTHTFTVTFGTSTCTFSITVVGLSNDYFPRTTGSNWSYEFDNDALDSLYRTVIAATHSANGKTYNIFMADFGTGLDSSGYYTKIAGDYYEWFNYGEWFQLDNPGWGEYIMLKDNVPVGNNWKSNAFTGTLQGTPITVRFSMTILQKDVAASVTTSTGTVNYTNVIVVEERLEALIGPTWTDITSTVGYGKSYYARGIGLIKFEQYDAANSLTGQQELRRKVVL